MKNRKTFLKFKNQFKNLNFYSMPTSILFIVRKRLNFVFAFVFIVASLIFSFF